MGRRGDESWDHVPIDHFPVRSLSAMPVEKDILSVPEAAERLGCSQAWVLRLLAAGELEGFRLSRKAWAVSAASVEKNYREYQERDPGRAGRKRSAARGGTRRVTVKPLAAAGQYPGGQQKPVYISRGEAGRRLGVSPNTVARAARRAGVGIFIENGRLAALSLEDLVAIKPHIHESSGNPDWIAAGRAKRKSRKPDGA